MRGRCRSLSPCPRTRSKASARRFMTCLSLLIIAMLCCAHIAGGGQCQRLLRRVVACTFVLSQWSAAKCMWCASACGACPNPTPRSALASRSRSCDGQVRACTRRYSFAAAACAPGVSAPYEGGRVPRGWGRIVAPEDAQRRHGRLPLQTEGLPSPQSFHSRVPFFNES